MSRQTLVRRLHVLESRPGAGVTPELVARLAADAGVSEAELLADAQEIAQLFHDHRAVTIEQRITVLADHHDITIEEAREIFGTALDGTSR
jgi:hypothetical protein